jgi:hypothetical protein
VRIGRLSSNVDTSSTVITAVLIVLALCFLAIMPDEATG